MTRCSRCRWNYPDELVTTFVSSFGNAEVCGICALALSNQLHGDNRKKFHGQLAEEKRLDAIDWRKKHPQNKGKK